MTTFGAVVTFLTSERSRLMADSELSAKWEKAVRNFLAIVAKELCVNLEVLEQDYTRLDMNKRLSEEAAKALESLEELLTWFEWRLEIKAIADAEKRKTLDVCMALPDLFLNPFEMTTDQLREIYKRDGGNAVKEMNPNDVFAPYRAKLIEHIKAVAKKRGYSLE